MAFAVRGNVNWYYEIKNSCGFPVLGIKFSFVVFTRKLFEYILIDVPSVFVCCLGCELLRRSVATFL